MLKGKDREDICGKKQLMRADGGEERDYMGGAELIQSLRCITSPEMSFKGLSCEAHESHQLPLTYAARDGR